MKFMAAIEDTDTDKDVILSKLASMIESHYNEIMECMRDMCVHLTSINL